ncbi:S-methyl-5-thioribose-1-phosphate isomerase [Alteribacter aurantiacus]|uniref:S-methyl-5-thioribose-1-phosphate isomerase n=1 Tax=Alteribacter aurantiacus TaxID=254410 RepID=UPI0004298E68|nr:S-methyl-5-thioribose-1-phosphate isomerase [Alteribacter aurantiacus]
MTTTIPIVQSVRLTADGSGVVILDQTLLPGQKKYETLSTPEAVFDAIIHLKVRGAPAIGIAAAYGVYLGLNQSTYAHIDEARVAFQRVKAYLGSSRPTAVNLFWALERMEKRFERVEDVRLVAEALRDEAEQIRLEDERVCEAIGVHALELLEPGDGILTHCNAGTIATAKYGTALAPIYLGEEQGYNFKVFADETRPLLQGARLTAWELSEAGVDVTLICDSMASIVMSEGKIQAVLVGCDRVAANGDTANKIGTSAVAILAKHYGIPFYVCAPTSTIDLACETGADIEIEERAAEEITSKWYEEPMAPAGVKTYNPAFDVTSGDLITAIVTENGVVRGDYFRELKTVVGER